MSQKIITIDLDACYIKIPVLARQYLDAPGLLYGRDPNVGIDCLGLVAMAATQAGFDCPHMLIRTPGPDGKVPAMMDRIAADMSQVSLKDLQTGDVLWFRFPSLHGRPWDHLAIISGGKPLTIIHTDPTFYQGVREHRLSEGIIIPFFGGPLRRLPIPWSHLLQGAFRFEHPSLEDMPDVESVLLKSTRYGRAIVRRVA